MHNSAQIVPIYAAIFAVMFVALSIRTIRARRRLKIGIGDGGSKEMLRAMRVHSNFAEYVPFALLMLTFVEMGGGAPWRIYLVGTILLIGRVSHAYGVSQEKEDFRFRVVGVISTFIALLSSATFLLIRAFS